VKKDGKDLDVTIKTEEETYKSVKDLENKKITTPTARK
jgi:HAE1 family hydrophobic/amphiphilic exporter-1